VHHGSEFLCALLNEQPMGFYPPDSLAHEAQRRGIELRAVDVNASAADCTVEDGGAVRIGLGYVRGVRADEVEALVGARNADGQFTSLSELIARVPAALSSLEQLAWSGACDALAGSRRSALWSLGVAIGGRRVHAAPSSRYRSTSARRRTLRELGRWDRLLANYATSA